MSDEPSGLVSASLPDSMAPCIFDVRGDGTVLAGEILCRDERGYITPNMIKTPGGLVVEDNHWLIVPWAHVGLRGEMPMGWDLTVLDMILAIPGFFQEEVLWPPYMVYRLHGMEAGQSIYHTHDHVLVGAETIRAFCERMLARTQ